MNKNTLGKVLIFIGGVMFGSAVTWKLTKTKYEKLADEEIAAVKEVYDRHSKEVLDKIQERYDDISAEVEEKLGMTEEDKEEAEQIIEQHNYRSYSDAKQEKKSDLEDDTMDKPYIIRPEQFEELENYKSVTLRYFADGTLMYEDDDEPVDDVEEIIGSYEVLDYFGEYCDDAVYVRDDERQTDYEILLDMRTYAEYLNSIPSSYGG